MMYIEIDSPQVFSEVTRNGNELRYQIAYMWSPDVKYPTTYRIGLGSAPPYEPGKYLLGARSFRVSQFGNLELDRYSIELNKLTEAQCKALLA